MPQFYQEILPKGASLGLWQIEEDETFFLNRLDLHHTETEHLSQIKGRLRLEWLASRYLLHKMSGRDIRAACLKDEFGKPYIVDSEYEISISHSRDVVAIMAAPYNIGIDIQKEVLKIERIEHKFISPLEKESIQSDTKIPHLHIYWGAKEALYKAYGRKELGFIEHIQIEPFNYDLAIGKTKGTIRKGNYEAFFDISYKKIKDAFLVYAIEQ